MPELFQENILIYLLGMDHKALLVASLLLVSIVFLTESPNEGIGSEFEKWQQENGIIVDQTSYRYRLKIFEENCLKVRQHNQNNDQYKLGVNMFAHLTSEEFKAMYTSFSERQITKISNVLDGGYKIQEIDWERLGKVSPVSSMGSCDAGYAFCTSSLLESHLLIKKNQNISLSSQQIVDCADKYQTFGCSGGTRTGAIQYSQEIGLTVASQYPYTGTKGDCKVQAGQYRLPTEINEANGCDQLASKLLASPLTIAANTDGWQLYRTGIFNNCGSQVNHDVYLVGVTNAYWKIKNSWGVNWGQFGYIRIAPGNTCGVCSRPGYGFS